LRDNASFESLDKDVNEAGDEPSGANKTKTVDEATEAAYDV
jgi:hypothetical protein